MRKNGCSFRIVKDIVSLLFVLVLSPQAMAQQGNWTFFAGGNQALGDFAEVDLEMNDWALISEGRHKGGAGFGGGAGVVYLWPMSGRTSIAVSVDFFYTGVNTDIRHKKEMLIRDVHSNFDKVSVTTPAYINVPVLIGGHYEFGFHGGHGFYLEAQAGLAFRWITNRSAEFIGGKEPLNIGGVVMYDYIYTDHYLSSPSLAFHVAFGLVADTHWVIDLGLWNMGTMIVEGYEDYSINPTTSPGLLSHGGQSFTAGRVTPKLFTFRVGYRL